MDFSDPSSDGLPYPPGAEPGIQPPPPLAPATPDDMACMRGPCRYFWSIRTNIDHGNAAGTFEHLGIDEPQLETMRCTIQSGVDFDMEETNIFACSRWDPMPQDELIQITKRRDNYYKHHPEHDPSCNDLAIADRTAPIGRPALVKVWEFLSRIFRRTRWQS
jgi:hypothetical protein